VNLINDFSFCPKCNEKLKFNFLRYHHIGNAYCPNCDFKSYDAKYHLTNIDYENQSITVSIDGKEDTYPMVNRALYNIYNELAAISLMNEFNVDTGKVKDYLRKISVTQTRYKEGKVGNTSIIRTMAKGQNSVSCSRTLDFVGHEEGEKSVFIMIDDLFERKDSSEFIGWIYDADFEFLNTPEMKQVILAGPRCFDYKLRLLIAGLPEEKILCEEDEFKAIKLIDKNVSKFYLLHDTSTYDLACEVEEKIIEDFKAFNENGGKQ
jgi:UDP-N-acetylmuramyl tripeptide synthase